MTRSEVHNEAMELALQADMAKMVGDHEEAQRLIKEAFSLERLAAESAKNRLDLEPSRSVLFRSAASLALESGKTREAERLAALGLSGNPPDEIADELRDVLERSSFQRHLELHGYRLLEDEFQISLAGNSVSKGIAPYDEVMPRAESAVKLLYRTAQRRSGKPFRDTLPTALKKQFSPQMAMPRAASFAVSIRFAESTKQLRLPGFSVGADVIDEVLTCSELLSQNDLPALTKRMGGEAYLINFLRLTEKIAPDGERVKTVGFTALRGTTERKVSLQIPKGEIDKLASGMSCEETSSEVVEIEGQLLLANSLSASNLIKVRISKRSTETVLVPEGLMDDIVRPLWNRKVLVMGTRAGKIISLRDIKALDD